MMRKKNNMKHRSGGGGRRYHGGRSSGGGGGGNDGQNLSRRKHHAMQMREKYSNMARDAQNNGDRVDVEYYLQHVDHYGRVLSEIHAIEAERYAGQRDQQVAHGDGDNAGGNGGDGASGADVSAHGNADGAEDPTPGNQPRMTRQHHRRDNDNGGNGGGDIPLPENILPAL